MSTTKSEPLLDIAIIGMAGRFPGAPDPASLWQSVRAGKELLTRFSDQELEAAGVPASLYNRPDYVKVGGVIDEVDCFDAEHFGYSPREAALTDPQHRLFLESAWAALENAGYPPLGHPGRVGVYASASLNSYLYFSLQAAEPELLRTTSGYQFAIASDKDYIATRVSYLLDLKGPSIDLQTACSSSLVAIHYACQGLLSGELDLALAGAATVKVPHRVGYLLQEGTTARDGHCRPFDAGGSGTVFGSGVGVVVLKRLDEALADRDTIYAVIKATAINNDGRNKVGFTAPSIDGQAAVISEAISLAGVAPETISYVETHGTATPLGDPVEIAGLVKGLAGGGPRSEPCAIGTVKSNLGHLEVAAGVIGLIKTALALHHRELPPSLHFESPNPSIDFSSGLLRVNTALRPWPSNGGPRRAGVSSFGVGGTNAHAVLEEAPPPPRSVSTRDVNLLVLSARTPAALERARQALARHLEDPARPEGSGEASLADVAYTLQVGRTAMPHRLAVACRTPTEAVAALKGQSPRTVTATAPVSGPRPVAFAFPGGGTQHVHMARGVLGSEPVFRAALDTCAKGFLTHLGRDIREALYPAVRDEAADTALSDPGIALPTLFAVEYALARLLMSWGIRPDAIIGHSFGEYVAACIAGVLSLEDALALVARRGQLIARLPPGAMLSVAAAPADIQGVLPPDAYVSLINAPSLCVVSGTLTAVDTLSEALARRDIRHRRIHFAAAMHCPLVDPIIAEFVSFVRSLTLRAPQIPYLSNVTGTWITAEQAVDPEYWVRHMRETVRFSDSLATLFNSGSYALIEVGPGQAIASFARQQPGSAAAQGPQAPVVIQALPHPEDDASDTETLLEAVGKLWAAGVGVNWAAFHEREQLRRVPLPTYAFERTRHWIAPEPGPARAPVRPTGKREDIADWFYVSTWKRAPLPRSGARELPRGSLCLLLLEQLEPIGAALSRGLREQGYTVACVTPGAGFAQVDAGAGVTHWVLDPRNPEDYAALIRALRAGPGMPRAVAHLWTLDRARTAAEAPAGIDDFGAFDQEQERGLYSLLRLGQALAAQGDQQPVRLCLMSSEVRPVTGHEQLRLAHAPLFAAGKVISQEYLNVTTRTVDIGTAGNQALPEQLVRELTGDAQEVAVAYRNGQRWTEEHTPVRLEAPAAEHLPLRQRGVYLLTGGCGNVGLELAEYLARTVQARLVLTGRAAYPSRDQWPRIAAGTDDSRQARTLRKLLHLEQLGGEVLVVQADVANAEQMAHALRTTEERFGRLDGIIHAAGHVGENAGLLLHEFDVAACRHELTAKVQGTLVLDRLLGDRPLDFRVLVSSVSATLGGLGHFAYTAANTFLDSFAQASESSGRARWKSWGSELWNNAPGHDRAGVADFAMSPAEGVETFVRVLACEGLPHVIVSSGALSERVARWVRLESSRQAVHQAAHQAPRAGMQDRPALRLDYAAPSTEIEQQIAAIWSQHLGVRGIGVHDNFFELGGHSLLATQIVAQIREAFQIDVSMRLLYKSPTVGQLARAVEDALLAEIEGLSEEKARALLGTQSEPAN